MSNEKVDFFFSYRGGRQRQISREQWEREWLEWWIKNHQEEEESDSSS